MRFISACIVVAGLMSACAPTGLPGPDRAPDPALGEGDFAGAPPAPGGAETPDRDARRAYYRGPRGHEF